ncbi:phosphosugar-binding regulatory protein [Proteus mirabilis]|uniref:Phosphosugar-binding regulatory protein n=1 Tax=Proteus mirabilis TaxID=584 RepID=A0A2X2C1D2_PROMI|nr:phosphosugar-binding regulatory protein [Proteus mirabilis]
MSQIIFCKSFAQANSHALQQLAHQTHKDMLNKTIQLLEYAETIYIGGFHHSFSAASYFFSRAFSYPL